MDLRFWHSFNHRAKNWLLVEDKKKGRLAAALLNVLFLCCLEASTSKRRQELQQVGCGHRAIAVQVSWTVAATSDDT